MKTWIISREETSEALAGGMSYSHTTAVCITPFTPGPAHIRAAIHQLFPGFEIDPGYTTVAEAVAEARETGSCTLKLRPAAGGHFLDSTFVRFEEAPW